MIRMLLWLQFPLLYVPTVVLGLIVYGSDFGELTGKLYLIPLIVVPLLHQFRQYWLTMLTIHWLGVAIYLGAAVCAILVYRQLHFAFWDEHSLSQAVYLSLLGLLSYLASIRAALYAGEVNGGRRIQLSVSLLVIGITWWIAVVYPMINLFLMACVFALGVCWFDTRDRLIEPVRSISSSSLASSKIVTTSLYRYLAFLTFLELGLIVWDFQIDTAWAYRLAMVFVVAALMCSVMVTAFSKQISTAFIDSVVSYLKSHVVLFVALLVAVNFIAAIIWPVWVIHLLHAMLAGLALGLLLPHVLFQETSLHCFRNISFALPIVLGMVTGYLFYANLVYAEYRILLLVPVVVYLVRYYKYQQQVEVASDSKS